MLNVLNITSGHDIDLKKLCRTCACVIKHKRFDLFTRSEATESCITSDFEGLNVLQLNIKCNDGLPQQICTKCSSFLAKLQLFHRQAIQSQEFLMRYCKTESNQTDPPFLLREEFYWEDEESDKIKESAVDLSTEQNKLIGTTGQQLTDTSAIEDQLFAATVTVNNTLKDRVKHNEIHCGKSFQCDKCDKMFGAKANLYAHRKIHIVVPERNCPYCQVSFTNPNNYNRHVRTHVKEKPIYKCQYCDKTFHRSISHKDHENLHTGEKPYLCNICGMSFKHYSTLKTHSKIHIDPLKRCKPIFQCDKCSKNLFSKKTLKAHIRLHTGERPYACDQCDVRHITTRQLNNHRKLIHGTAEERESVRRKMNRNEHFNYSCTVCDKQFRSPAMLSTHMRKHDEKRDYLCTECGDTFKRVKYLRIHINLVHLNIKNFLCTICSQTFGSKDGLIEHTRSHTGERPFECSYCEKTFTRKRTLRRHISIHSKESNFQCDTCGRDFKTYSTLYHHRNKLNCGLENVNEQLELP